MASATRRKVLCTSQLINQLSYPKLLRSPSILQKISDQRGNRDCIACSDLVSILCTPRDTALKAGGHPGSELFPTTTHSPKLLKCFNMHQNHSPESYNTTWSLGHVIAGTLVLRSHVCEAEVVIGIGKVGVHNANRCCGITTKKLAKCLDWKPAALLL